MTVNDLKKFSLLTFGFFIGVHVVVKHFLIVIHFIFFYAHYLRNVLYDVNVHLKIMLKNTLKPLITLLES